MTALTITTGSPVTVSTDALIVAVLPGRTVKVASAQISPTIARRMTNAIAALGGTAKVGEVLTLGPIQGVRATRVVTVGYGGDAEQVRRAFGDAVRACSGLRKALIALPDDLSASDVSAIASGARLAAYGFDAFKSKVPAKKEPVRTITLVAPSVTRDMRTAVRQAGIIANAIDLTRDLVNTPPNALWPEQFAKEAKAAVADVPVRVQIWDVKALERDGCGGILAVGQGSVHPPRLVKMTYAPRGATCHLAIVGKGITFDTGGISIKPAPDMHEMKGDMAGAAAVVGAMQAIATLGIPTKVTAWVPMAENMPSGTAQRPGDVITMHDGTTVEVLNTDAEGRLILGDALAMAVKDKPDLIVDIATLTGAQRIALGARIGGVMSNDDEARAQVVRAGDAVGDALWPMPLPEDLRASLDSPVADIANIGDRLGGMLSAGVFLQTFIPEGQAWVHVDIAGPAYNAKGAYGYTPKGGTGAMVRTLVRLAEECAAD